MQKENSTNSKSSDSLSEKQSPPVPGFQSKILVSALQMAFGTMSSRVLGLLREVAFAALFSRTVTDAWSAAFRLPNLFRRLLGEGSLAVSFIPVFVETRQENGEERDTDSSKNFVSAMFTCLFCLLTVLTVLGVLFSEEILLLLLDEQYRQIPGKFALTVRMAQIMFGFIFLMSMFGFFMGILNALGIFALPALAPTLFNVAMIVSTLVPHHWFPYEGDGLAWGVLIGGALQMGILIPALRRKGYLPNFRWDFWQPSVKQVFLNMLPGFLGMGLLQITTLVNLSFASQLGEGVISYIYWADRLLELPLSLVSVSLGTALLPTLATFWSQNKKDRFAGTVGDYLRITLYAALPAAAGLFCLALPLVELIFMRGRFSSQDALQTADILQVYAFILISTSCVRVVVPAYYAVKNTWLPAVVSGVCLGAHLIFAPFLMSRYGVWGLNVSTLLSGSLNLLLLLACFPWFVTSLSYRNVLGGLLKFLVPTFALVGVCSLWPWFSRFALDFLPPFPVRLLTVVFFVTVGGLVFIGVSRLIRLQEYERTFGPLLRKVQNRFF